MIVKIKKKVRNSLLQGYIFILNKFFPYEYARYFYKKRTGKDLNYNHVENINEKLFWLARYWQHPLVVLCADKFRVREYVEKCGCGDILNDLYAVYDSVEEIDFKSLPASFALKCNHGCGYNILCKDKNTFNEEDAKEKLALWMRSTFGINTAQYHYQYIRPKIILEKYIQDVSFHKLEVQVFCFNGEPDSFLVRNDLGDKEKDAFAISYTLDWKRIRFRKAENMAINIPQVHNYKKIIEYAKIMAKPFPQVRIDFYEIGEKLIFGELTFSTSRNILANYTDEQVLKWGNKLILPSKYPTKWREVNFDRCTV